ncbi:MAG: PASTA domain-containing protein [Tannerellaceae bacterium]|jgi:beta-lactam-binding protein with PASTA domain|nr:PASTA domain-containing protein [Tannerellaceae bacterium]
MVQMKHFSIRWAKHPLAANLLIAVAVSCILLYATLKWLNGYTLHNKAVRVPEVKGMQVEEAFRMLQSNGLNCEVMDSVFNKDEKPGAVVALLPVAGSKVKPGRKVLVTVNALSSRMGRIPGVKDVSFRQAHALLTARGFKSVEIEYVSGTYKDLAIGVELRGRLLEGGEMVPLTAPLILKVSNGVTERTAEDDADPLGGEEPVRSDAETWF